MTTKKKIPWGLLYIALLFILAGAYYISGLFTFPDVTLINYGEYLTYILLHPFHLWWNDKTPVVMGTACILWLMDTNTQNSVILMTMMAFPKDVLPVAGITRIVPLVVQCLMIDINFSRF